MGGMEIKGWCMKLRKETQLIVFKCVETDVFLPKPIPASEALPDWYKEAAVNIEGAPPWEQPSFKNCMPIFDAMTQGYIIPLYADLFVKLQENGVTGFHWKSREESVIGSHSLDQTTDLPLMEKSVGGQHSFKFTNPWLIQTPKGYSTLFIPPLNNPNPNFETISAIVATDSYHDYINFPFVWTAPDGWEGVLPQGTPICQAIPFKRVDFQHEIGVISPADRNLIMSSHKAVQRRFKNTYKDLWRKMVRST